MSSEIRAHSDWRRWLLLGVSAAGAFAIALHPPIPQDTGYHAFADHRTVLGVPNFWNVVSNLPFLIVGILGLRALRKGNARGPAHPLHSAYAALFAGVVLICFGSAFYHLAPDNNTLVWDRLPMTIAFMAFLAIVIGERVDQKLGRQSLPVLLLAGVSSVLYWHRSELWGAGDLRPYLLVQFLPLALVPIIALLFPAPCSSSKYIWAMLASYVAAKIFEVFDEQIFHALGSSGHTLKHVIAAAGVYFIVLSLAGNRSHRNPRWNP